MFDCRYCRRDKGHSEGCPVLDGNMNEWEIGFNDGLNGRKINASSPSSYRLGWIAGNVRAEYLDNGEFNS